VIVSAPTDVSTIRNFGRSSSDDCICRSGSRDSSPEGPRKIVLLEQKTTSFCAPKANAVKLRPGGLSRSHRSEDEETRGWPPEPGVHKSRIGLAKFVSRAVRYSPPACRESTIRRAGAPEGPSVWQNPAVAGTCTLTGVRDSVAEDGRCGFLLRARVDRTPLSFPFHSCTTIRSAIPRWPTCRMFPRGPSRSRVAHAGTSQ